MRKEAENQIIMARNSQNTELNDGRDWWKCACGTECE